MNEYKQRILLNVRDEYEKMVPLLNREDKIIVVPNWVKENRLPTNSELACFIIRDGEEIILPKKINL